MECHNISFKCVPCNRKFKWKRSFVRHSRECRNASPIYNCSKCDFFSFRKFSLERHTVDIHDGKKTEKVDNAMERSAERTHMSSSQEFSCLFIGGDKKIYAYRFNDNNKSKPKVIATFDCAFVIEGIDCVNDMLVIIGGNMCVVKTISHNEDKISLEDKETISLTSKVEMFLFKSDVLARES